MERGRDPTPFVQKLAEFATRRVRSGRLFAGARLRDVLSPMHRPDCQVESLTFEEDDHVNPLLIDALTDRKTPSPPDEAAARIDFADWLATLDWRKRHAMQQMARGWNTVDVRKREGVTGGAISMMRQKLAESCPFLND